MLLTAGTGVVQGLSLCHVTLAVWQLVLTSTPQPVLLCAGDQEQDQGCQHEGLWLWRGRRLLLCQWPVSTAADAVQKQIRCNEYISRCRAQADAAPAGLASDRLTLAARC